MQAVKMVVFSDYLCPFCFIANEIVKRLKQKYTFDLEWRPFELHPNLDLMPDINSDYIRMAWRNVERLSNEYNVKIELPKYLSLSRKALMASEFAKEHGKFDECHDMIFNAYFLEGKDMANDATLIEIINKLSLNEEDLKKSLKNEAYLKNITNSIRELHSYGITGVPAFFIGVDPKIIIGAQPQELLEKVINKVIADENA